MDAFAEDHNRDRPHLGIDHLTPLVHLAVLASAADIGNKVKIRTFWCFVIFVYIYGVLESRHFSLLILIGALLCGFTSYVIYLYQLGTKHTYAHFAWYIIIIIVYINNTNLTPRIEEATKSAIFRWPWPLPRSESEIEYRVQWPILERAWPAELRIASIHCDYLSPIQVSFQKSNEWSSIGLILLNKRNFWSIPISEVMFEESNVLALKIRNLNTQNNCALIFSKWDKQSSFRNNTFMVFENNIKIPIRGALLAQIWDPKY